MKVNFTTWFVLSAVSRLTYAAPQPQTTDVTPINSIVTVTSSSTLSTSTTTSPPSATNDACAQLAAIARQLPYRNSTVPADAAWNCLQAVPFDQSTAEPWLQSLQPYIRWQSTLSYLKNPPAEYPLPPYDLVAKYNEISSNARNGSYGSQYDFELAIYRLFQQTYDEHANYEPNMVSEIVRFGRRFALVSISSDGQELPKPYVYSDVLLSYNTSNFEPSPIVEIDGQAVNAYLERYGLNSSRHDKDSQWSSLFLELASVQNGGGSGIFAGSGRGDVIYPGATTNLTFENGTTRMYQNYARLLIPFSNITSAQDLYRRYVDLTTAPRLPTNTESAPTTPGPGYPPAVIRDRMNIANGYYLNDTRYRDVAILGLSSFFQLPISNNTFPALQFLDRAKADGKTKLVIDLSANGGGLVSLGFAVFNKLFPNIFPYMGTRLRAIETVDIVGQIASDFSNGTGTLPRSNRTRFYSSLFDGYTPFVYASDVDENYQNFPSWQAKFGPHEYNGDNFTSIIRWNFSQPAVPLNVSGINNASKPLFAPENIILLTDGYCASTCSNFVEMMTQQAGVKTITVGGRPSRNITQAVGATRGGNNYAFNGVLNIVNSTYEIVRTTKPLSEAVNLLANTELGEYLGGQGGNPVLPFTRAGGGFTSSLNVRDNIRKGDQEQIPLQFRYDPADCRIFWTKDMTVDITALWKEVIDITWGDGECIAGSIQGNSRRVVKRSAAERMRRRSLERRTITSAEIEALAERASALSYRRPDGAGAWL